MSAPSACIGSPRVSGRLVCPAASDLAALGQDPPRAAPTASHHGIPDLPAGLHRHPLPDSPRRTTGPLASAHLEPLARGALQTPRPPITTPQPSTPTGEPRTGPTSTTPRTARQAPRPTTPNSRPRPRAGNNNQQRRQGRSRHDPTPQAADVRPGSLVLGLNHGPEWQRGYVQISCN